MKTLLNTIPLIFILLGKVTVAQTPYAVKYINYGNNPTYTQIWSMCTENKNRILLLHRYGLVECDSNLNPTKCITSSAFINYPYFVWGGVHIAKSGIYLI